MKAALHNLGCKVNAYETEAMQQILEEAGYEIVPFYGVCGCLCDQYMLRDQYGGPQVQTDAAPGEKAESGCDRRGEPDAMCRPRRHRLSWMSRLTS